MGRLTNLLRFGTIAMLATSLLLGSSLGVAAEAPQGWVLGAGSHVTENGGRQFLAIAAQHTVGSNGDQGQFEILETNSAGEVVTRIHGTVLCVVINGNSAAAGGPVEGLYQGTHVSSAWVVQVVDNDPDAFGVDPGPESFCEFGRPGDTNPIDRGNLIVRQ